MQQKCASCFLRSAQSGWFERQFYATAAWATVCGGSQRWAVRLQGFVTTWTTLQLLATEEKRVSSWSRSACCSDRLTTISMNVQSVRCHHVRQPHHTDHVDMCVTLKSRWAGWLKQKLAHSLIILKGEFLVPGVTRDDSHGGSKSEFGVLTLWHNT